MQGGKSWILRYQCKPVLLKLLLAGNLEKPFLSLYGTEWRKRGYGLMSYRLRLEWILLYLSLQLTDWLLVEVALLLIGLTKISFRQNLVLTNCLK